jgi:phosphate uptake regulator
MFKRLFTAWTGKDLLSQAFDDFNSMLEVAEQLFDKVTDVLLRKPGANVEDQELCARDSRVNQLEHSVREKIIEYLAFEPEGDRPAALLLFSVVKDAERLGDFCKDIMEIAGHFPAGKSLGDYREPFLKMEAQLEGMFSKARNSFLKSNKALAKEVVDTRATVKAECRELLAEIMADRRLNSETAASLALAIYFFKRVAAHLFNIASSVIVPVTDIGHYKTD